MNLGCASAGSVARDYRANHQVLASGRRPSTTVFFLVDGFATPFLSQALADGRVPNLEAYFRLNGPRESSGSPFRLGRASFPTLTYPNLVSILTARTVGQHGVLGNRIFEAGKQISFEDIRGWDSLAERLKGRTVFASLAQGGESSVSYSYPFTFDATAAQKQSIQAGWAYTTKTYDAVDAQTLSSLERLLTETPMSEWPTFLFVHLISVDSFAHEFGPGDPRVQSALADLDLAMKGIYARLETAESAGMAVRVVLTADHGFASIKQKASIQKELAQVRPELRVIEDNRVASVWIPARATESGRELAEVLSQAPRIEWVARKTAHGIELYQAGSLKGRIEAEDGACRDLRGYRLAWQNSPLPPFTCADELDNKSSAADQGYLLTSLSEFFSSREAPDLVVLAAGETDFSGEYRGNHGGLTANEILVPLLTRGVQLEGRVIPTHQLLRRLGLMAPDKQ